MVEHEKEGFVSITGHHALGSQGQGQGQGEGEGEVRVSGASASRFH